MIENKRVIAIIPARGGSKSIPRKNLYPVAGRPLIAYTIEAARISEYVDEVIVSSDDADIISASKELGAGFILRPPELAADDTKTFPVVVHAVKEYMHWSQKRLNEDDFVVCLQPTSPLRESDHIDAALENLEYARRSGLTIADAILSVYKEESEHIKTMKAFRYGRSKDFLRGLINEEYPFTRRQDLPPVYIQNGAIYACTVKLLLEKGTMFSSRTIPYMMNKQDSIDIDSLEDIAIVEKILQARNEKG